MFGIEDFIQGEWCAATGAVFPDFDNDNIYINPMSNPSYYIMGIDYGTTNPTAALLCSITPHMWPQMRVEEEYYYDSRKNRYAKNRCSISYGYKKIYWS